MKYHAALTLAPAKASLQSAGGCGSAWATMMRLIGFVGLLSVLAACAQTQQPTFLANGQQVVRITCDLAIDGMTACFKKAGDICATRGFVIYDWNGHPWATPYPSPDVLDNDPTLAQSGLLVACRA